MKNDLLALYIKHDSNFQTISKIALNELVLKILFYCDKGATLNHITSELNGLMAGEVSNDDVNQALQGLKNKSVSQNGAKYYMVPEQRTKIQQAITESEELHSIVVSKFFGGAETDVSIITEWFKQLTVKFFEKYNFEWFHLLSSTVKRDESLFNLDELIMDSLKNNDRINEKDKEWLHRQYRKFVNESDYNSDKLFWQYGLSSFSARLITAKNFANKINIEAIKDTTFVLDTNVLMILDLESHQLNGSITALEKILLELNINMEFFYCTQEEYRGAISWKRLSLKNIFEEYDKDVLFASDCPFIKTALTRGCQTIDDVNRMFDGLEVIPSFFAEKLPISINEEKSLTEAIERGKTDRIVIDRVNTIYKKFKFRDKRDAALCHDAGLIAGVNFLRAQGKKTMILTNDTTLKRYSTENVVRDDAGVAIGLDVLIGVLSVSAGGTQIDPTDFAPLFKNIVNTAMMPSRDAFEVEDLAFILGVHLEINKMPVDKVIEIAKKVNQKTVSGVSNEEIGLYLRREVEKERIIQSGEAQKSREKNEIMGQRLDEANEFSATFIGNYEERRRLELMKHYQWKKLGYILIWGVSLLGTVVFVYLGIANSTWQYVIGCAISAGFAFLPRLIDGKKVLNKQKYQNKINKKIEEEIEGMSKKHDKLGCPTTHI